MALLVTSAISALIQLILFTIPVWVYVAWQRLRHKRPWGELRARLGLIVGDRRYLAYGAVIALVAVGLTIWMVRSIPPERSDGSCRFGRPTLSRP